MAAGGGGAVAGFGDDLGFAGVVFGVEHFVFDAEGLVEELGEFFRILDAGGADEDGPAEGEIAHGLVVGLEHELDDLLVAVFGVVELVDGLVDAAGVAVQLLQDGFEAVEDVGEEEGVGGSAFAADLVDFLDDGLVLVAGGAVDLVVVVDAVDRAVGGDGDDVELVDLHELVGLGEGGARHAGAFVVELEEVLDGNGGHGLGFFLDRDVLLGLAGLVETVGPLPADHEASGELVDDDDLAVLDDVVLVALVDDVGAEGLLDEVGAVHVGPDVEAADLGFVLGDLDAVVGQADALAFELDDVELFVADGLGFVLGQHVGIELEAFEAVLELGVVGVALRWVFAPFADAGGGVLVEFGLSADQDAGDVVGPAVLFDVVVGRSGDDQRGAGLVDEDGVDLVDDAEVEGALHLGGALHLHVVAEVVEPELVVGPVSDIATVGLTPFRGGHPSLDTADRNPQEFVDCPHPFPVAAGQVVVDRDQVDVLPGKGVEVEGHRGHQGLPLPGRHLGDLSLVEDDRPDQLDVEGDHLPEDFLPADRDGPARQTPADILHRRVGLGEEFVEDRPLFLPQTADQPPFLGLQLFLLFREDLAGERGPDFLQGRPGLPGPLGVTEPELIGLGPEFLVAQSPVLFFQPVDLVNQGLELFPVPVEFGPEDGLEDAHQFFLRECKCSGSRGKTASNAL